MFNLFDYFILTPLRLFFQGMYEVILIFISNYGFGIIGLSCVTALILIPIEKAVRGSILKEKKIESVLLPQLTEIKQRYSGIEKNNAIKRLYKRYGYSPLYAIRNVYGVLIQLPFLIGAYLMLSSYEHLSGQSFLFIKDLSLQDHLLGQINLLPILMTIVNLSTLLFLNLSKKENIQASVIAFAFLVLLYSAPSALLLYWTMNNVIHLLRAFFKRIIKISINGTRIEKTIIKIPQKCIQSRCYKYLVNIFTEKYSQEFFKKSFNLFILLILLTPLARIGSNIGYYSPEVISRSLSLLLIISFCFISIVFLIRKLLKKSFLYQQMIVWTSVLLGAAIYYQTIGYLLLLSLQNSLRILIIGTIFLLTFIIGRFKLLNVILTIHITLSFIIGGINNYYAKKEFLSSINKNQTQSEIQLKHKPNIYYLLCESMNSLDIAEKIYGLNSNTADEFKLYLKDNGFYVPDYIYTNGSHTLKTLQNVYLMTDYIGGDLGFFDGSTSVRPMLAGDTNNRLLKILKDNGYYTSSYMCEGMFSAPKGVYLDYFDIDKPNITSFEPLLDSSKILRDYIFNFLPIQPENNIEIDAEKIIDEYFKKEPPKPHFMMFRVKYTNHTGKEEAEAFTVKSRKDWIQSNVYLNGYYKEISALKYLTSKILKNDPNAIIIMLGDHGAHLYRTKAKNKRDLIKFLKETEITYSEFINDKFKVFAAVRIPQKYKQLEHKFSPGNIFPIIFSLIGYEGKELSICENNSYFTGYIKENIPIIQNDEIISLDNLED